MPEVIYLNGRFVSPDQAVVSVNDRGFLFGDSVYDAVRSYDGRLWALERHMRRLARSLQAVDLTAVAADDVGGVVEEAFRRSEIPDALVYMQITRGAAPRRHAYTRDLSPTVLVTVRDMSLMPESDEHSGISAITAPDMRWRRCDIKSTNLLPNILARTQAADRGAEEAILVDADGFITEGAAMTVFCAAADRVLTTPLGPEILPSITREFVIEIAEDQGIPVGEERVPLGEFRTAEEVFLGSTTHDVCAVVQLDGKPVSDGKVGPIARRLKAGFQARVAAGDDAPR